MEVIDYEQGLWFYVRHENDYFMDIICNNSSAVFSILIKLNEIEIQKYKKEGKIFLNSLAKEIQYSALTIYKERNISGEIEKKIHEEILKFNQNRI